MLKIRDPGTWFLIILSSTTSWLNSIEISSTLFNQVCIHWKEKKVWKLWLTIFFSLLFLQESVLYLRQYKKSWDQTSCNPLSSYLFWKENHCLLFHENKRDEMKWRQQVFYFSHFLLLRKRRWWGWWCDFFFNSSSLIPSPRRGEGAGWSFLPLRDMFPGRRSVR